MSMYNTIRWRRESHIRTHIVKSKALQNLICGDSIVYVCYLSDLYIQNRTSNIHNRT